MIIALSAFAAALAGASAPEVTVYNQGFGFIKEVRALDLKSGDQRVAVENVPAKIDPTSVGVRSLDGPDTFSLLEQNYQYDLISPSAIINKSVGKRVRLIRTLGNSKDVLEGTLLNAPVSIVADANGSNQSSYNGMVIKTDDGRIVLDPRGEIEVEQVPEGLITRPTLFWDLEAPSPGKKSFELSYITQGMSWTANYVLTLSSEKEADMQGWVTVDNQSGATFKDAKLKLLAGEVNQVPVATRAFGFAGGPGGLPTGRVPQFQEQSLFEYHLYTLQRPTTLQDRETKQVSLLEGHQIAYRKKLIFDAMEGLGSYYPSEGQVGVGDLHGQVRIEFVNSQENHLGMPLPAGKIRIYERDTDGSAQFLGEDHIDHTPRNETLSLVVGRAFDVVASRKRLSFTKIDDRKWKETFEVEVRNRKETDQQVYLLERHWGDWSISNNTDPFTKEDANTVQFILNLKPNEVKKVTYTVLTQW
jgi:hypothetical protein